MSRNAATISARLIASRNVNGMIPWDVLEAVGRLVGGKPDETFVKGTHLGSNIEFSFVSDSDARSTSLDVEMPLDCPLVVELTPYKSKASSAEAVTLHGMLFGIVAPFDVAERLFDRKISALLCALERGFELSTIELRPRDYLTWGDKRLLDRISDDARKDWGARKLLRLTMQGWIDDPSIALRLIEVMASLPQRLAEAQTAADAALAIDHSDAPYRGTPRDSKDLLVARHAEVSRAKRALTRLSKDDIGLLVVAVVLAPFMLLIFIVDRAVGLFRLLSRGGR